MNTAIGVVICSLRTIIKYPITNIQSTNLNSISGLLNLRTNKAINTLEDTIEIKDLMQIYFIRLNIKKIIFEEITVSNIKKRTLFTIRCLLRYPKDIEKPKSN